MKNSVKLSALGLIVAVLSGCATTFSSQVTTFQEWPNTAPTKTYVLDRTAEQENDLEYKQYADRLREKLSQLGLTEAAANETPALSVKMAYATSVTAVKFTGSYYGPRSSFYYDPIWSLHYSRFYSRSPFFYPAGYSYRGGPFSGSLFGSDFYGRRYYLHQLAVTISDKPSGKKLFDVRASTEQSNPEIVEQIPFLLSSAFQNFPGENGKSVTVNLHLLD